MKNRWVGLLLARRRRRLPDLFEGFRKGGLRDNDVGEGVTKTLARQYIHRIVDAGNDPAIANLVGKFNKASRRSGKISASKRA